MSPRHNGSMRFWCVCWLLWSMGCLPGTAATLALRHVTVIDGNGTPPQPDMTVLIRGNRIASVAPFYMVRIPKEAQVIDARGQYLIPGLWDMHVHLWFDTPLFPLYLAHGVTGVRDMGSTLARTREWRRQIQAGKLAGPRIFTSGPVVDGQASPLPQLPAFAADTPTRATGAVETLLDMDVDFVKIMSGLSHDAYDAVALRARQERIPFAGHVPESVTVWEAIDARQRSMEHLFGIAMSCSSRERELRSRQAQAIAKQDRAAYGAVAQQVLATYDPARAHQLFEELTRFDVWQTPTLTYRRRAALLDLDRLRQEPAYRSVPARLRAGWADPEEAAVKADQKTRAYFVQEYELLQRIVREMQQSGVKLLAGTDTGDDNVVPGAALHAELELLVAAGLSPMQALQTATRNPAEYFGKSSEWGTVEAGKRADLVLLDANPLEDIRNTRRIAAVMVDGRWYTREELAGMVKALQ